MNWLRKLVRRWLGHTAYHRQANEVQVRLLRAQRLARDYDRDELLRDHYRRADRILGDRR